MTEQEKDITILAIESSCDETAASVVVNGREVLSNVISSQIDIHTLYGGVVPEIASRKHTERINQVVRKGLSEAGKSLSDMDAIAVTYGPGLVGPLLIGVSEAKALSFATGIPLIGRGAYQRELHRGQGAGTAFRVPCGLGRAYPPGPREGLRRVRDPGADAG